jgi:hypothetical protein
LAISYAFHYLYCMETLNRIVGMMDAKEVRNFKIYLKRVSQSEGRKDIALFDAIRAGGFDYDEERVFSKLYGGADKNAFYRLKNRLTEDLHQSLFMQYVHSGDNIHTLFLLGTAYVYASRNEYTLAMRQLKKAEKKAKEVENYSLLNIIYYQMMTAARELTGEDPEYYIEKRRENRRFLNKLGEVDDILVGVEYRMMRSQNLAAYKENTLDFLKNTIDGYTRDKELRSSARLQFGIYLIVSRILLQNKDYPMLEKYLKKTYYDFSAKKFFTKAHHHHKLQILAWIANALFMNKKYNSSLEYTATLHREMQRFDRMLYDKFAFFYNNCLFINYSQTNPPKAIDVLLRMAERENIDKLTFNGVFVYLNLAVLYYGRRDYASALKYLNKLYNYPGYKSADMRLKLRVSLGELMMRLDLGDREVAEYRLRQVRKDFVDLLGEKSKIWEKKYLNVLSRIGLAGKSLAKHDLKETARETLHELTSDTTGEELMFPFDAWLREKAKV